MRAWDPEVDETMASADLLLHPVRLRIVQALLGGREMTTADIRAEVTGVPPATLYRQIAALADGGVLEVAAARKVRGAVERTYRLRTEAASVGPEEAAGMTRETHARAFLTFVSGLLADFDRYLAAAGPEPGAEPGAAGVDLARDMAGYRQAALYLTDEELADLLADLRAVLEPRLALRPGGDRVRRLLTTVLMPAPEGPRPR
ncbi:helix-turn-helix domain-containing protein [Streptomyces sp. NPDC001380]|uniref:helix-turn-helix domain-containing protein n=1 Tax=Streptomyces sp. NPDC001380 TaxID=3364566 RepID=UPI00367BB039